MNKDLFLDDLGDGVFQIRLERPERMNALGVATVSALEQAVADAAAAEARVLLIRGSGRAFCAGADLKERKGMDLAARMAHNAGINAAVNAVAASRCVTISVLNGLALGGGLELALACDLRIAAAGISLGLTESRVGAFPGAGGTQRLPRVVGASRALHMMLSGEPVTSEYALGIGLVNELVAPESLDERAIGFARSLAGRSAAALTAIKRLVYQGIEKPLADGLRLERAALPEILGSADYAEGLAAFAERRPPRFNQPTLTRNPA
ncbi:enoyl-CoA hydratase/isomerase family protein [Variovorax saccharolyticus]|uniref:enoyl-CoA hydratase/isomerase family protein n=1 Tax=Variovorax saccharolyticus TaxID=3053516 RepID=UPI002578AEE3|nr:enoyl-CoA hydratase/isomerase family protein [Variovorax sp. J22R187]MDM0021823.1 enoyl-CoA hydratase/isomerase family protein [Variovorax sp. J22R187]